MSTHKLSIPALKAALACASKDASRECICAVFVEFNQTETLYVATDGKCIGCVKDEASNADASRFLMRADTVKAILKTSGAMKVQSADVTISGEAGKRALAVFGNSFAECPCQFPNWRTVFPKPDPVCAVGAKGEDVYGFSSGIAEKAGAFWAALDPKSFAVMVPAGDSTCRSKYFFGLYSLPKGERSKLPLGIRATFYAIGYQGARDMLKDASEHVSYFPSI